MARSRMGQEGRKIQSLLSPLGFTLTRSPGSLLSNQRAMMTSHVALTGGRVAMKPSGLAWPLVVGGGSCMVGGRLGIQTQESN
jgi:hypothetical protein